MPERNPIFCLAGKLSSKTEIHLTAKKEVTRAMKANTIDAIENPRAN